MAAKKALVPPKKAAKKAPKKHPRRRRKGTQEGAEKGTQEGAEPKKAKGTQEGAQEGCSAAKTAPTRASVGRVERRRDSRVNDTITRCDFVHYT